MRSIKRLPSPLLMILIVMVFLLAPGATVHSSGFVDFDGDGIDDNLPDGDSDGIPDDFESHGLILAPGSSGQIAAVFANVTPTVPMAKMSSSVLFGQRQFNARCLSDNRFNFDAAFSSGIGAIGGAGSGGACAGGVCR